MHRGCKVEPGAARAPSAGDECGEGRGIPLAVARVCDRDRGDRPADMVQDGDSDGAETQGHLAVLEWVPAGTNLAQHLAQLTGACGSSTRAIGEGGRIRVEGAHLLAGELREVLREARARGYALEDGEVTLGLGSVGVAVLDHVGWPIAAIAVTYSSDGERDAAALAALVSPMAQELGRRIRGARPA